MIVKTCRFQPEYNAVIDYLQVHHYTHHTLVHLEP